MKESHMLSILRNAAIALDREDCQTTAGYVRDVIQELETRWGTEPIKPNCTVRGVAGYNVSHGGYSQPTPQEPIDEPEPQPSSKPTVEELAAAIRELFRREDILGCQSSAEFEAVKWRWREAREAVQALLDAINGNAPESDQPSPQESKTVAHLRRFALLFGDSTVWGITGRNLSEAADELEAAEQQIADLQSRGTLYDLTDLRNECSRLGARVKELESREPAPVAEVDWVAWGERFRDVCLRFYAFALAAQTWKDLDDSSKEKWCNCGHEVAAAYEAQKGAVEDGV